MGNVTRNITKWTRGTLNRGLTKYRTKLKALTKTINTREHNSQTITVKEQFTHEVIKTRTQDIKTEALDHDKVILTITKGTSVALNTPG